MRVDNVWHDTMWHRLAVCGKLWQCEGQGVTSFDKVAKGGKGWKRVGQDVIAVHMQEGLLFFLLRLWRLRRAMFTESPPKKISWSERKRKKFRSVCAVIPFRLCPMIFCHHIIFITMFITRIFGMRQKTMININMIISMVTCMIIIMIISSATYIIIIMIISMCTCMMGSPWLND